MSGKFPKDKIMSITVKTSFGERFLNWYAQNTSLYRFAEEADLSKKLNEFFEGLAEIKELRELRAKNERKISD